MHYNTLRGDKPRRVFFVGLAEEGKWSRGLGSYRF